MVGLVDCNSFYASCERIFRPDLQRRPIVVLSNNDGCIVAMDSAAKQCGIRRGTPYFEARGELAAAHAEVFSSNYTLYQDISNRVMEVLASHAARIETYSIDEAFLFLDQCRLPFEDFGAAIRGDVLQCTGIPVSIGFGRTKTLAKIANRWAKKHSEYNGIFQLCPEQEDDILSHIQILDIWGIGSRKAAYLFRHGVRSARDLRDSPDHWIKKQLTLTTLRTVWELRGIASIEPEPEADPRRMILSSLGFSRPVSDLPTLEDAVSIYSATAARKLIEQGSEAAGIMVFILTNRHREPSYAASRQVKFPAPTSYLPEITRHALGLLRVLYRQGYDYSKAGVCLFGIDTPEQLQYDLFPTTRERNRLVTECVTDIQLRFGRKAITSGRSGAEGDWLMRRASLSPRYTTRWNELPSAS